MKTVYSILIYALLVCSSFAAGWDTNAWSGNYHRYYLDASTNKVFIKEALSSDAFAAIEERAIIAGVSAATTNAWFRNNRADLVNVKSWINSNAGKFFITNSWVESDFFSQTLVTNTFAIDNCVDLPDTGSSGTLTNDTVKAQHTKKVLTWTGATLLSDLALPTNYLTSTPWRKLTDPATSNGWQAIDDLLNKLIYPNRLVNWVDEEGWYNEVGGGDTWSDATNNLNEVSSNSLDPQERTRGARWSFGTVCQYESRISLSRARFHVNLATDTNYTANINAYVFVGQPLFEGRDTWPNQNHYDAQTSSFSTQGIYNLFSATNIVGLYTNSTYFGSTNITTLGWIANPDTSLEQTSINIYGSGFQDAYFKDKGWSILWSGVYADYTTSSSPITYYAD